MEEQIILYAEELASILTQMETDLTLLIAEGLNKAEVNEMKDLQLKLDEVKRMKVQANKLIKQAEADFDKIYNEKLKVVYEDGYVEGQLDLVSKFGTFGSGGVIDQDKVKALAKAYSGISSGVYKYVLRQTMDEYRQAFKKVGAMMQTGEYNKKQAIRVYTDELAKKGITKFVDKSGRRWSLDSYAEMVVRTNYVQTSIAGRTDCYKDNELKYVIVSEHPEECPKCRPWENKVLRMD